VHYDVGYFGDETCRLGPIATLIGRKSVTYVLGTICDPRPRAGHRWSWRAGQDETANTYVIAIAV